MKTTARDFAIAAHGDQKYGEHPYSFHLDMVAQILIERGYGPKYVDIAYLHDVLEDTTTSYEELVRVFGQDVADAVKFCSDEPGKTRRERKAATYARIKGQLAAFSEPEVPDAPFRSDNYLWHASRVKLADRLANLRMSKGTPLFEMYRKERDVFKDALYVEWMADKALWAEYDSYF